MLTFFDLTKLSKNCYTEHVSATLQGSGLSGAPFSSFLTVRYALPQLLILQLPGVQKFGWDGQGRQHQDYSKGCRSEENADIS